MSKYVEQESDQGSLLVWDGSAVMLPHNLVGPCKADATLQLCIEELCNQHE